MSFYVLKHALRRKIHTILGILGFTGGVLLCHSESIMARSDEAQWWFNAVYEAVQEIPPGSVTSYGHIALLLGRRKYFTVNHFGKA